MSNLKRCLIAGTLLTALCGVQSSYADWVPHKGNLADRWAARHARGTSWHANYYHTAWGRPISLVVPPTAHMQTSWAWGVSQDTMTPIHHQYRKTILGDQTGGGNASVLYPTPYWPSHTDQFGVYYIRGPY